MNANPGLIGHAPSNELYQLPYRYFSYALCTLALSQIKIDQRCVVLLDRLPLHSKFSVEGSDPLSDVKFYRLSQISTYAFFYSDLLISNWSSFVSLFQVKRV